MSTPPLYTTGGTVQAGGGIYISRQADTELLTLCQSGTFAYILTSRQMGKSSLMVQTATRLGQEGIRSATIDLSELGVQVTAEQWYLGFLAILEEQFGLETDVVEWWRSRHYLGFTQRMSLFFKDVLLVEIADQVVIFVDEIDSTLSLDFTDDFFAAIRYFYVTRSQEPAFHRLSFVLIGVAAPSDLIRDKSRTPFNIGYEIVLAGFQIPEVQPLMAGFANRSDNPPAVLSTVLDWTSGQPFLTQKLCQLILDADAPIAVGQEATAIEQLIRSRILENWETQDQPEHLRTIRDRLLFGGEARSGRLLGLYQEILAAGAIGAEDSAEQMALRLTGLVVRRDGVLRVYNRVYAAVFDRAWVEGALAKLRPAYYGVAIEEWKKSGDESRLLRGEALRDAIGWAEGKQLSDEDSRFLRSSQEMETREVSRRLEVEAEANGILAEAAKKANRRNALSLLGAGVALAMVGIAIPNLIKARTDEQRANNILDEAKQVSKIEEDSTLALRQFETKPIPALITALKAGQQLQTLVRHKEREKDAALINQKLALSAYPAFSPIYTLNQILSKIQHRKIPLHRGRFGSVILSGDGQIIATAGNQDDRIKLWNSTGELIKTIETKQVTMMRSRWSWSRDNQTLITGGLDGSVKFWSRTGVPIKTIQITQGDPLAISWSDDGKTLVSVGEDDNIRLWNQMGRVRKIIKTQQPQITKVPKGAIFLNWNLSLSGDGKTLATSRDGRSTKLWSATGELIKTIQVQQENIGLTELSWSNDSQTLATNGNDSNVKLWDTRGNLIKTIKTDQSKVTSINWSEDSQTLVTGGGDGSVKFWSRMGKLIKSIKSGHNTVLSLSLSGNSQTLVTTGLDDSMSLWRHSDTVKTVKTIEAAQSSITSIGWSGDSQTLVTNGNDSIKLWTRTGSLIGTIDTRQSKMILQHIGWSRKGKTLASTEDDGNVKLWNLMGKSIGTIEAKQGNVLNHINWSGDGKILATSGNDGSVKLWSATGYPINTIKVAKGDAISMGWSKDGEILVTSNLDTENGNIKFWSRNGTLIKTIPATYAFNVNWSGDDQTLSTSTDDNSIKLWSRTGEPIGIIPNAGSSPISWNKDGQTLATSIDGTVKLWSRTGELIRTIEVAQGEIGSLSWSSDGQILATGGLDGTVKLWSRTGNLLKMMQGAQSNAFSLSWREDSKVLATGGKDRNVRLWDIDDLDTLLIKGCDWANRYLIGTPQELKKLHVCHTPQRLKSAAPNLIEDSEALAREGDRKGAIEGFTTAKQWDPSLSFDPVMYANQIAEKVRVEKEAQILLETAIDLANKGEIDNALKNIRQLQQQHPDFAIGANSWNGLCWRGATRNQASKVLFACEQAVTLDSSPMYRDGRGLARALTGNISGAIEDFQVFIQSTDPNLEQYKAQRESWIRDLQSGKNPFTPEVLQSIQDQ